MLRIGLIDGNGLSATGGGSIQMEYDLLGKVNPNVEITHFIQSEKCEEFTHQDTVDFADGGSLHNVVYFDHFYSNADKFVKELDNRVDYVIVLSYPKLSAMYHNGKSDDHIEQAYSFYESSIKKFHKRKFWGVVCYDYTDDVVFDNIGFCYDNDMSLFELATKIWINNERNPLAILLKQNGFDDNQLHFECPQFMVDNQSMLSEWAPSTEKLDTICYHGRGLDWKGWSELPYLVFSPYHQSVSYFGLANGIKTEDLRLLTDCERDLENLEFIYSTTAFDGIALYNTCDRLLIGGKYTRKQDFIRHCMFGFYYTTLKTSNNFFPEYSLIDTLRSGTVCIVPSWYFDTDEMVYNGFILYDSRKKDDKKYMEKFFSLLDSIGEDPQLYSKLAKDAYSYMVSEHGAEKVFRFLGE